MLKHLPDDVLKTFQKELLYIKKPVIIKGNAANTIADRRNPETVTQTITLKIGLQNLTKTMPYQKKKVDRIPLKYVVDIGLVNLPTAFNVKFVFNLEKTLSKLFESRKKLQTLQQELLLPYQLRPSTQMSIFTQSLVYNTNRLELTIRLTNT